MRTFTVDKNIKLSEYLIERYGGALSAIKLAKLFDKREIKVNGVRVKADCVLTCGDRVECYFEPKKTEIEIVYRDENILICNKNAGVISEDFYEQVKTEQNNAIFTHRLDRNTSGIMVFALNEDAYNELFSGFKDRTIEKYYTCLVNGHFDKKSATLSDFMFKDSKKGLAIISHEKKVGFVPIITRYEEIERGEKSSVLRVLLVTGRTHQIRAHLAFCGHFIIGDGKYGNEKINREFKVKKQLLVANEIIFHFNKGDKLFYLDKKSFSVDNSKPFEYLK